MNKAGESYRFYTGRGGNWYKSETATEFEWFEFMAEIHGEVNYKYDPNEDGKGRPKLVGTANGTTLGTYHYDTGLSVVEERQI